MASDLNWKNDVQLAQEHQDRLELYRIAYREMKALRDNFEQGVIDSVEDDLPVGHTIVFSYRFGKLGMAIAPETTPKKRTTAPKAKPTLASLFG